MFRPAKEGIDQRLAELCNHFDGYVHAFAKTPPFGAEQLGSHLKTLQLCKDSSSAHDAARSAAVAESLRETLRLWGIGSRGAEIATLEKFKRELNRIAPLLSPLEGLRIDDLGGRVGAVADSIWYIISGLDIVSKNGQPVRNRVVSGTKTLHHLLPDLVPPMDREYTQTFFGWANPEFQNHPKDCFRFAFEKVAAIARSVHPQGHVGAGWNSNRSKVLDNAIVGFCRTQGLVSETTRYRRRQQEEYNAIVAQLKAMGKWEQVKAEIERRVATTRNSTE